MIIGETIAVVTGEVTVGAAILALPHAVDANGDMLVGLQISPVPVDASNTPDTLDLVTWPARIGEALVKELTLHVADVRPDGTLDNVHSFAGKVTCDTKWSAPEAAMALRLWNANFDTATAQSLADALSEDARPAATKSFGKRIAPLIDTAFLSKRLHEDYARRVGEEFGLRPLAAATYDQKIGRLKQWTPPGLARDPLGIMIDDIDRHEQTKLWKDAARSRSGASTMTVADDFSVARARALNRAEQLENGPDTRTMVALDQIAQASKYDLHDALHELALVRDMDHAAQPVLPAQSPRDRARRKLASVLSTPSLATFVGMNVEVRITQKTWEAAAALLQKPGYGALAVTFGADRPANQGWTAFVHGSAAGPDFFGPCDKAEALARGPSGDAEIVGGVLNLRCKATDGDDRYVLDITDVVTSTNRQQEFARRTLAALRTGDPLTDAEPNLLGRGLTLVDRDAVAAEVARNARLRALSAGADTSINFAADLLRGYAVMVGIPTMDMRGLISAPERWRTVMARGLTITSPNQVDRDFVARSVGPEREFGVVTIVPVEQTVTDEDGVQQQMPLVRQEIFCWHGDSLSVARPSDKDAAAVMINVDDDFAVSREYHLPDAPSRGGTDYRAAPLRDGMPYLIAMTAVYVGGWGLSVSKAAIAHAADRHGHVLGGRDLQPFRFKRPDKLPPPQVLLPSTARLVTASRHAKLLGETLRTLIVRSANGRVTDRSVQRFLFPIGVDFDRAEQQNQFRGVKDNKPHGAFRSSTGIQWADGGGKFPIAVGGGDIVTTAAADKRQSRGAVLHFQAAEDAGQQYYPDASSQFLRMQMITQTPSDLIPPPVTTPVPFWTDKHAPREALPILLELRGVKRDTTKPRIVIDSDKVEYIDGDDGSVKVRKIRISVQPATKLIASTVAHPSSEAIVRRHLIGDALINNIRTAKAGGRSFAPGKTDEELAVEAIEKLLKRAISRALTGVEELTLVHAQERPDPPRFLADNTHRGVTPVVVTVAKDTASRSERSWADIVHQRRSNHPTSYDDWESEEGGATCFFVGEIEVDPAATGAVRCEAQWKEWSPDYLKRKKAQHSNQHDHVDFVPGPGHGILFAIDTIPSATTAIALELLGSGQEPRALAHSFTDGRARHLFATMVATSRFAEYFEDHKKCESRSATKGIWVPCTFQPPVPTVDRITPVFDYDYRSDGRGRFSFTRTSRLRLELGDDVFKTGEDERIGVLFRASGTNPCDLFTPELEPFADGFTVQGRNPLHQSPVRDFIGPDRLRSGGPHKTGVLKAERPDPGTKAVGAGVAVDIVPHALQLDEQAGFYCDVMFDPTNAADRTADLNAAAPYLPFVHLGLARYQEHSMHGLELSHAIGRDVQLLPWRHGSVQFYDQRQFTVRIEGPMSDEDPRTAPWLEITLVRTHSLGHGKLWVPVTGPPDQVHCPHLVPKRVNGRLYWEWTGHLPHNRTRRHYGLQIRERERQFITEDGKFRDRDNLFSATVDLRQHRTTLPVEMVAA